MSVSQYPVRDLSVKHASVQNILRGKKIIVSSVNLKGTPLLPVSGATQSFYLPIAIAKIIDPIPSGVSTSFGTATVNANTGSVEWQINFSPKDTSARVLQGILSLSGGTEGTVIITVNGKSVCEIPCPTSNSYFITTERWGPDPNTIIKVMVTGDVSYISVNSFGISATQ